MPPDMTCPECRTDTNTHKPGCSKGQTFVVMASQHDDNIFYVRRGDGSHSNQDEATVVVFGKQGSAVPSRDALDFIEKALGAKGYETILADIERLRTGH